MSGKHGRFRHVVRMANRVASTAQKRGNVGLARQAVLISHLAGSFARAEQSFNQQADRLNSIMANLNRLTMQRGNASVRRDDPSGYFVGIAGGATGKSKSARGRVGDAYHVGIIGRRIGRGPVKMTSARALNSRSTKVMTAAFQKLLFAQSQLVELRAELDRLKQKK